MRAFAEHLGIAIRTVSKWEAGGCEVQPRPHMQAILDTAIGRAGDDAKARFDSFLSRANSVGDVAPAQVLSDEPTAELRERLSSSAAVDAEAISLLASQADRIRELDRCLGARSAELMLTGYLDTLRTLRTFAVAPNQREALADLYADAAALAGWQSLDLGHLTASWQHHEAAKDAGREGRSLSTLVHAMAQQAYVLLDLGENERAVELVGYARQFASTSVPRLLQAWLLAVDGEAQAFEGNALQSHEAFDAAEKLLPEEATDPELPYIMLDPTHLGRWRGNALAKLGEPGATEELRRALDSLDATFTRARAGLHVDLAQAHMATNQQSEARSELRVAKELATQVGSARQRRRIRKLETVLQ
ncbi:MAG: XRE family transcriptional regulator [Micromonosporaceae bacterium]